jgi:transposase
MPKKPDHTIARLHCLKEGRHAMRMIFSVLALAASLDAAIAQQPPAANAQPPQPAFVNGALAVPGVRPN